MNYDSILVEESAGIGKIVFNNGPLNIFNIAMMREINSALDDLFTKPLKTLILTHNGKFFSAGVDIGDHMGDMAPIMLKEFHQIFKKLNKFTCPVIGVAKGTALGGGCEIALMCDILLASEKTKFGQPEIKVGVFPPIAILLLPLLIPEKKGFELVLLGETISAVEAKQLGLVNHVYSLENFEAEVSKFLDKFEQISQAVIQISKKAFKKFLPKDFDKKIDELEELYLNELMNTHDANEGLQSYMEKRSPIWKNE